MEDVSKRVGN